MCLSVVSFLRCCPHFLFCLLSLTARPETSSGEPVSAKKVGVSVCCVSFLFFCFQA